MLFSLNQLSLSSTRPFITVMMSLFLKLIFILSNRWSYGVVLYEVFTIGKYSEMGSAIRQRFTWCVMVMYDLASTLHGNKIHMLNFEMQNRYVRNIGCFSENFSQCQVQCNFPTFRRVILHTQVILLNYPRHNESEKFDKFVDIRSCSFACVISVSWLTLINCCCNQWRCVLL